MTAAPPKQSELPIGPEPLRADCRVCGLPAVPGLRLCRDCWIKLADRRAA